MWPNLFSKNSKIKMLATKIGQKMQKIEILKIQNKILPFNFLAILNYIW